MSAVVTVLHATHSKTVLLYAVNSLSVVKRAQYKGNSVRERVVQGFAADDHVLAHKPWNGEIEVVQALR